MKRFGRQMNLVLGAAICLSLTAPVLAQDNDKSLADIRRDLSTLYAQIEGLRSELSTTGAGLAADSQGPALVRIDSIEQELRSLTGRVEQMQFNVGNIVKDGTNRIADLEFRLVALEGGDLSQLGETTTLGGNVSVTAPKIQTQTGSIATTAPEEEDYETAMSSLDNGDFVDAAEKLLNFTNSYPGGPLSGEAHYWRGEALVNTDNWNGAAKAFLESFSGSPDGRKAPNALYRLGVSLGKLGKSEEACLTLSDVAPRYPNSAIIGDVQAEMQGLGCT
jgi:tol-pal system protein YbgF